MIPRIFRHAAVRAADQRSVEGNHFEQGPQAELLPE
jgi:hypothetical protein